MNTFDVYVGDALERLKEIPDKSVNCCVTSPPYYGLRDYGTGTWVGGDPNCPHARMNKFSNNTATGHRNEALKGNVGDAIYKKVCPICGAVREDKQIGLEESPEEYVDKLVIIFEEVRRILTDDGTLWLNLGDSYVGSGSRACSYFDFNHKQEWMQTASKGTLDNTNIPKFNTQGEYKNKDLIGIPWMVAFALRKKGWFLRQDIIWKKPNPMPESVRDRFTKSHEYIFLMSKNSKYYFDYESTQEESVQKVKNSTNDRADLWDVGNAVDVSTSKFGEKRHMRDVWDIVVSSNKIAHFATFPIELVEPCILAGCPVAGTVLDPFNGSGTTGIVATTLGRNYIGIELNKDYVDITEQRVKEECFNKIIVNRR